jgi:hypothetical protein
MIRLGAICIVAALAFAPEAAAVGQLKAKFKPAPTPTTSRSPSSA